MNRKSVNFILPALLVMAVFFFFGYTLTRAQAGQQAEESAAVGSAFTYQGRLNDDGVPANGSYDFEFGLYDDLTVGNQIGITMSQTIAVSEGLFTTALDFGVDVFNGEPRFLEIAIKLSGGGGFTTLTPRQPLTAVPYASYAAKAQPLENVVNVAKSGGDYTSVQDALDNISTTASNRYLIRVAPGVYTGTINLESYVDIEGSGAGLTILRGFGNGTHPSSNGSSATLQANNVTNSEIRFLTVESNGTGNNYATAIWTGGANDSLHLNNVAVVAMNGSGINSGLFNYASSPKLENMIATAAGGGWSVGIYNYSASSPMLNNVTATASGATTINIGIYNFVDSFPTIRDSAITGTTNSIKNDSNSSAKIANSMLEGSIAGGGNSCINTYDASFAAVGCP